ncbi:addiction module protein [Clostridia bacterium]|nr:addiction module protein [Clostridia bacterium]
MYLIVYEKKALKDIPKLKAAHLDNNVRELIEIIRENPFQSPPRFEKLSGDLKGLVSRRINAKHRFVYQVLEDDMIVKIVSMWTHYEF